MRSTGAECSGGRCLGWRGAWQHSGYTVNLPTVRLGNEPEFISSRLVHLAQQQAITLQFIEPASQHKMHRSNDLIVRVAMRCWIVMCLNHWRRCGEITENWCQYYNQQRPQDALNKLPAETYTKQQKHSSYNKNPSLTLSNFLRGLQN